MQRDRAYADAELAKLKAKIAEIEAQTKLDEQLHIKRKENIEKNAADLQEIIEKTENEPESASVAGSGKEGDASNPIALEMTAAGAMFGSVDADEATRRWVQGAGKITSTAKKEVKDSKLFSLPKKELQEAKRKTADGSSRVALGAYPPQSGRRLLKGDVGPGSELGALPQRPGISLAARGILACKTSRLSPISSAHFGNDGGSSNGAAGIMATARLGKSFDVEREDTASGTFQTRHHGRRCSSTKRRRIVDGALRRGIGRRRKAACGSHPTSRLSLGNGSLLFSFFLRGDGVTGFEFVIQTGGLWNIA